MREEKGKSLFDPIAGLSNTDYLGCEETSYSFEPRNNIACEEMVFDFDRNRE